MLSAAAKSSMSSVLNGVLYFVFGVVMSWAAGYALGTLIAKNIQVMGKRRKSILPDVLGFIGLCLGALVLKDIVFK